MFGKIVFVVTTIMFISEVDIVTGIRCYACSSNNDGKCILNQSEEANIISCDTGCISAILPDASLFRGCSADLPKQYAKEESCVTDLCNKDIFPQNRLACYHCSGPDCADVNEIPKADSQFCQKHVENDTCFTYVHSKAVILRGCASDTDQVPRTHRKDCDMLYCNKESAAKQLTCWECDSCMEDELACKMGKELDGLMGKCEIDVLLGREGFCYVWQEEEHVIRGCSDNSSDKIDKKYMKICKTSLCNEQSTIITHCHECDSRTDINCKNLDEKNAVIMNTCPEKTSSCFACRNFEDVVRRGCGQSDQCNEGCFSCWNGSMCNSNKMFVCYSCDSSTDPQCELLLSPDMVDEEICNTGCEVKLTDGILYRGCMDETKQCSEDNFCSRCFEDSCNDFYIDLTCHTVKYINNEDELDTLEKVEVEND